MSPFRINLYKPLGVHPTISMISGRKAAIDFALIELRKHGTGASVHVSDPTGKVIFSRDG